MEKELIQNRFDSLEQVLEHDRLALTRRMVRGFAELKNIVQPLNGNRAKPTKATEGSNLEELAALVKDSHKQALKPIKRLLRSLLWLLGLVLLVTIIGFSALFLSHRQASREMERKTPSTEQLELMLMGMQQKLGEGVQHVP